MDRLRDEGHSTIGIYAKTNTDAAGLSAALTENSVDHTPIGFGEAYGESLSAMVTMMAFSQGLQPWQEVGSALGVALAASVRSREPPSLAVALRGGAALPAMLQRRMAKLQADLDNAGGDVIRLAELSAGAWEALGIASGRRAWSRAGRSLVSLGAQMCRASRTWSSLLPVRLSVTSPSVLQPIGCGTQLIRSAARREQVHASTLLREPTPTSSFAAFASNKPWVHLMLR